MVRLDDPLAEVTERIRASTYGFGLVVSATGVLLGRVDLSALAGASSSARLADLMDGGPSTVRPHTPATELAQRLARRDLRTAIVTDPEGRLIGVVRREDLEGG